MTRLDGSIINQLDVVLNETQSRVELGTINGLMLSVNGDSASSIVTLSMVDTTTLKYFGSHGSLGKNGEGVVLAISNNGKNTDIVCAPKQ